MGTYLDRILDEHRRAARADERVLDRLVEVAAVEPPTRGFRTALAETDGLAVISEVKRRSPSVPDLAIALDPAEVAREYEAGGANCLSVLTDATFFGGSPGDLQQARNATDLPTIRKDFTVSAHDICDARTMGADAVLLIVAALDDAELADFYGLAKELNLDVLVEIHDEAELDRALAVGADLIGVNQRDLLSFQVDSDRAVRLAPKLPAGVVRVAESGVKGPTDAALLAEAGYHAVLVGESLVTSVCRSDSVAVLRAIRRGSCPSAGSV